MHFIYHILLNIVWFGLHVVALFNAKIKLFVRGRKQTFSILEDKLNPTEKTIWMHVASLGEFEQGLPILERLRAQYPNHKLVLSFFSPSGYEVKKNTTAADVVVYLPMDSLSNAKRFLKLVHPELAIFVKYEVWPNYLHQLKKSNTPTILISAIFSKRQIYFKPYGGFMRKSLQKFDAYFVQDDDSKKLLDSIGPTDWSQGNHLHCIAHRHRPFACATVLDNIHHKERRYRLNVAQDRPVSHSEYEGYTDGTHDSRKDFSQFRSHKVCAAVQYAPVHGTPWYILMLPPSAFGYNNPISGAWRAIPRPEWNPDAN